MEKKRVFVFFCAIVFFIVLFLIAMPVERVDAQEELSSCIPNWNCTEWKPTFCPRNETQVRKCVDLRKCGIDVGKPSEVQACTFTIQVNKDALTAVFVLGVITFIISLVELIRKIRVEKKRPTSLPDTRYTYSS